MSEPRGIALTPESCPDRFEDHWQFGIIRPKDPELDEYSYDLCYCFVG